MAESGNWNYPTAVRLGPGRIAELADVCREVGSTAPLLVTDPGLADSAMVASALASCEQSGMAVNVFAGIQGNPTGSNVSDGISAYLEGNHDAVIAFGGGSALDAGKAIAFAARQQRELWDCEDDDGDWFNADADLVAPVIAVPTTAGTGSEVGRAALITHELEQVKKIVWHPQLLPRVVILDPELTTGLPRGLTAATGMDALSHNLEAWCAPAYHPMAEGIALQGMKLVRQHLPAAVAQGDDIDARTGMLVASSMGATAFQRGLGGMHALAHPLGALYDAHHGMLNAILMPYVLKRNEQIIADRMADAARYLDLPAGFGGFLDWVLELRESLDIPHSLSAIGIDAEQAQRVGEMAVQDPSAGGNPIQLSAIEYSDLFVGAVEGRL